VPLVDVIYDDTLDDELLRRLGDALPDIVAEAVDCPEEPAIGPPGAGDLEVRFRRKGEFDVGSTSLWRSARSCLTVDSPTSNSESMSSETASPSCRWARLACG
jgi:hypothetical protein